MSALEHRHTIRIEESGNGPYGQFITAGRHVFGSDEVIEMGGQDTGPDPFELLMAAIGSCTSMTIRMYAARKQWPLEKVTVEVRHVRTPDVVDGVARPHAFERHVTLEGDLTQDQHDRLLDIATKCPVGRALEVGSEVITTG